MRSLGLSLIALAALGCTETGAHLTLATSPDGPTTATSFKVVLATYDQFPEVRNQRVAPGDRTTISARYYLQKTLAGGESEDIDQLDGFTVRIAPDGNVDETRYIPFLIMYDGDQIVGIATYRMLVDNVLEPSPIFVMPNEIDKYVLQVEKATQQNDASLELATGEVRVVTCEHDDGTPYTSGIVWRAGDGEEYRILMPNDGGLDATGRALDMDCDAHEVTTESSYRDCDDTRPDFHRDAEDVCDGVDNNCDNATVLTESCQTPSLCNSPFGTTTGVQLCSEETEIRTQCQSSAYCACSVGVNCHACEVPFERSPADPDNDALAHPCQPIVGSYQTDRCTEGKPCDVEVLAVRGEWKVKVSPPGANLFGARATGITGIFAIKVESFNGPSHEEQATANTPFANRPLAEVDLAFIGETATYYEPLLIRLQENHLLTCVGATMNCY